MARARRFVVLLVVLGVPIISPAAPHPFFDDGNLIPWRLNFATAKQQALATGKPMCLVGNVPKGSDGCKMLVTVTLKDAKVASLIRRHFIPVFVDRTKGSADTFPYFSADKLGGNTLPFVALLNDKAVFMRGTCDYKTAEELTVELQKVLADKQFAIAKTADASLAKQVDALQKALEQKNFKVASSTFAKITAVRGYSPTKDKAYELVEEAQFDGTRGLVEALILAGQDDYAEAKKLLVPIAKSYAGLPVAVEAKDHEAIVKTLETVNQLVKDKKGQWKQTAGKQLSVIQSKYPDSAYTNIINKRKKDLD